MADEFFVTWLRHHGESNIVVDAKGVGLAGNPTRLRSSVYGSQPVKNGFTAELEFKVRLPDGREIVEYVAGTGDTQKKAEDDARVNFVVSTFHVVYRSFLNTNDPHQSEQPILMAGGPRVLVFGDTMTRTQSTNDSPDMFPLRDKVREVISTLPLTPQTHWIKIVYANNQSKVMLCAATLDNDENPALTKTIQDLPWPKQERFYMAKQFIVVK